MKYTRFASGHGDLPLDAEQPYLPEERKISLNLQDRKAQPTPKPKSIAGKSPQAAPRKRRTSSVMARQLTVHCPMEACEALVIKISASSNTEWDLDRTVIPPTWRLRPDQHAVFHLICSRGHKTARKRGNLPKRLQGVVSRGL